MSCRAHINSLNYSIGIRAQLDDTTTIMEALAESNGVIDRAQEYRNFSTVYLAESLSSGAHYIDIDAFIEDSGQTGYMSYMKIVVIRLDDWLSTSGMYAYTNTEGEGTPTNSGFATFETLTFTPDSAGDYLILGSAELKAGAINKNVNARLNYDSASEYLPVNSGGSGDNFACYTGKDGSDYMAFVWGGIVSLPASSKTILLESVSTSATLSRIRKRRIIAIRIDAMDSIAVTDEDPAPTTTTSQWTDKSSITFTPASTEDYLIFGGMIIEPSNVSGPGHSRLEHTVGTGTGTISQCNVDSRDSYGPACNIPLFTVEVKSLTNTSQTIKTQWGYVVSSTIKGKASFIVAIRKPSSETTAYKDVPLKVSIESEDIFKDVPLKLGVESEDIYKDLPLKLSVESADTFQDIPLKISVDIENFKDVPLKLSIESEDSYKDLPLKVSVDIEVLKDIPLKISVESEYIFKDVPLKVSVSSVTQFKDVPLKLSIESEYMYKDIPLKTSIESAFTYQDVPLKITVSAEVFKDIPLKVSILVTYKLTGTTKDNDGNVLGSCKCYLSKDNLDNTFIPMAYQLSDAGTGIYVFGGLLDNDPNYQVIGWKDGSPNIFDVTDWILTPEIE